MSPNKSLEIVSSIRAMSKMRLRTILVPILLHLVACASSSTLHSRNTAPSLPEIDRVLDDNLTVHIPSTLEPEVELEPSDEPEMAFESLEEKPLQAEINNGGSIGVNEAARSTAKSWMTVGSTGPVTARHEACYVAAPNGKHYLIGGRRVNNVGVYDPVTKVWTAAPGPGVEIHHMQCVVTGDGRIWIPASWYGSYPFEQNHANIFIFNTNSNTWSTKPGLPESRRRGGGAAVLSGGKIYVSHGNRGGHGAHSTSLGWLDAYDIAGDTWITNLPTAPNARDHTGGAIVGGRLCVAGGRRGDSASFMNSPVTATDCYNFGTGTWQVAAPINPGRAGSAYGKLCGGGLMVAGGEGSGKAFQEVSIFDGSGWRSGGLLQQARHGTGLAISSCSCGQVSIASGSGAQGGGPELTSVEVWKEGGAATCA